MQKVKEAIIKTSSRKGKPYSQVIGQILKLLDEKSTNQERKKACLVELIKMLEKDHGFKRNTQQDVVDTMNFLIERLTEECPLKG